jgi:N-acetyltransferase
MSARLPTGEPLVGRTVRLEPLTEGDLPELFPLLADPEVYASGYVMHRRPATPDDGVALARERFLPVQAPDGRGAGRIAYAVRLLVDGTLVG